MLFWLVNSKKDVKKYQNNLKAKGVILKVIELLQTGNLLPREYEEHALIGNYIGYLECYGRPDYLYIKGI